MQRGIGASCRRIARSQSVVSGIAAFGLAVVLLTPTLHAHAGNDSILADDFESAKKLTIISGTTALEGWFWPARRAGPAPAVVLLHGCSGVFGSNGYGDDSHLSRRFTEWARRLNAAGMHALLVDAFSARDPLQPPALARQNYCGDREAVVAIGATEEFDRPLDAVAAYRRLLELRGASGTPLVDPAHVAVMGWSHGGSAAMAVAAIAADAQPFVLAQSFYPGCGLYGAFGNAAAAQSSYVATIPLDIHLGTDDPISSVDTCAAHAGHSTAAAGAAVTLDTFEGVGHSFDGASCDLRADGPLLSPWSGKRYVCSGNYNGVPFDLDDYRAALESRHRALCALHAAFGTVDAACDVAPPPP